MDADGLPSRRLRRPSEKALAVQKQEPTDEQRKPEGSTKVRISIPRECKTERRDEPDAKPQKSASPAAPHPPPPQPDAGPSTHEHTAEEDDHEEGEDEHGDGDDEQEGETELEEGESEQEADDDDEPEPEHGQDSSNDGIHHIKGYLTCPAPLWDQIQRSEKWDALAVEEWVRNANETGTDGKVYRINVAGIAALKSKYFFEMKRRKTGKGRIRASVSKRGKRGGGRGSAGRGRGAAKAATTAPRKASNNESTSASTSTSAAPRTLRLRYQPPTNTAWWKPASDDTVKVEPGHVGTSNGAGPSTRPAISPNKREREKTDKEDGYINQKRQKTETTSRTRNEPESDQWEDYSEPREADLSDGDPPDADPTVSFLRGRTRPSPHARRSPPRLSPPARRSRSPSAMSEGSNRGFDKLLDQIYELKEFDYEYVGSLMETHHELQKELEALENAVDLGLRYRARMAGPATSTPRTSTAGSTSTASTDLVSRVETVRRHLTDLKNFHPDHIDKLMARHDEFRKRLATFMDDIDLGFEYRDSVFENIDGRGGLRGGR